MFAIETKVRDWGNSLGITLPKKIAEQLHLRSGERIKVFLLKDSQVLKDTFGSLKFKGSINALLKESDKELYND